MIFASLLAAAPTTTTTVASGTSKSKGSILDPIARPIADFLAAIYSIIPNYGVAIVLLSLIWMIIIAPLTLKSTRSMLAMQKLQPRLKKLQAQHKDDKQAFAQAQMELFREHNVSPFGSCLPMLLPLPVFFALYRVLTGLSHMTNGVPTPKYVPASSEMYKAIVASGGQLVAFGMNLSKSAISSHSSFAAALPYWILLGIMAATSYIQSSQMMSRNPAAASNPQARMMRFLPLLFVLFCFRFPAGVVLYYTVSNICRIVQQDLMYRFDPKVKALVAQEVVEVEELTQEIDDKKSNRDNKPSTGKPAAASGKQSFRDLWNQATNPQRQAQGGSKATSAKSQGSQSKAPPSGQAKKSPAQKNQDSRNPQQKNAAQKSQAQKAQAQKAQTQKVQAQKAQTQKSQAQRNQAQKKSKQQGAQTGSGSKPQGTSGNGLSNESSPSRGGGSTNGGARPRTNGSGASGTDRSNPSGSAGSDQTNPSSN
jgi:YidC/Oxa1 family membrane protein insertase